MTPVTPQSAGLRRLRHRSTIAADLVDQRVFGVGLQVKGRLPGRRLLPRGRNRDNEAGRAATLPRLALKRLAVLVERMMQFRRAIGRVQNRPLVKAVQCLCPPHNLQNLHYFTEITVTFLRAASQRPLQIDIGQHVSIQRIAPFGNYGESRRFVQNSTLTSIPRSFIMLCEDRCSAGKGQTLRSNRS